MFRNELFRTAQFKLALAFTLALVACMLVTSGFVYWQTALVETNRIRVETVEEVDNAVKLSDRALIRDIGLRIASDLNRLSYAALFDDGGRLIAGNLPALPPALPIDGAPHSIWMPQSAGTSGHLSTLAARRRPNGDVVVLGRDMIEVAMLRRVIRRGLVVGMAPAIAMALVLGTLLSSRALRRVRIIQRTIDRIMLGSLQERLPLRGSQDDLDRLSAAVNRMLDRIIDLLDQVKSAGDNIAHDLRTPLSVMRAKLERALNSPPDRLQATVESALADLDKAFAIVTALLRIAEIEDSRRRSGFAEVDLNGLMADVFELYEPLAETRGLKLALDLATGRPCVRGDRDLLVEAVANLVDNALKFTPAGGTVTLAVEADTPQPTLRVMDNGPGIVPAERDAVLTRFYRAEKSRHVPGQGLGLSLVVAIVKLHGFEFRLRDALPGTQADLICG